MKKDVISCINSNKIIVIVRKLEKEYLLPVAKAIYEGGIKLIEVTFDQTGDFSFELTLDEIKTLRKNFDNKLHVGAGTVLTEEQVKLAYEAGAEFIISPNTDIKVIKETLKCGMVSIPGAMTPTEIIDAHNNGADFVKLFPAGNLGADYISSVTAPINHIKIIAVGGIDDNNMNKFISAGAAGVGVGSCIVRRDLIKEGEFDEITLQVEKMVKMLKD